MSKLLFVAFPISEKWAELFLGERETYVGEEFKWTTKGNLHMTLAFLGAVEEDLIPEIKDALLEIASIQKPFDLEWQGVEYGPEGKTPSMIWARFKDHISYGVLASRVIEEISYILGKVETLKPIPHVTLARLNKDAPKPKQFPELREAGVIGREEIMNINSMCLMESRMTQDGSTYNTLATFDFTGDPTSDE